MGNLIQKLEYLKWLKSIGVEYYFSEEKDSDISLLKKIHHQQLDHPKLQLSHPELVSGSHGVHKMTPSQARDGKGVNRNDVEVRDDKSPSCHPGQPSGSPTSRNLANVAESLEELQATIENFNGCDLKNFATNTVFADGNPLAKIMLVGEAPGAKEDELGIPFCGESGMLLDTMLLTIGLSRKENVYITNTVFWRPPANRRPTNQEMDICRPFLEKHIALINPKLIICVGSTAVNSLLGDKFTINLARSSKYLYKNEYLTEPINTMSIFHPAYLLRQSEKKKDMWFDLIKIQQFIKENL